MKTVVIWWAAMVVVLSVAALPTRVDAHAASTHYTLTYPLNAVVHWEIDNNVPSGTGFRDQVKFGIGRWDDGAGGQAPNFIYDGETTGTNDWNPCTGETSRIYVYEDLGWFLGAGHEQVLGATQRCTAGPPTGTQYYSKFQITFETTAEWGTGTGWYTGDGTPGNRQWDLRSIAAHEAGHAAGFGGHFESGELCPNPAQAGVTETMCGGDPDLVGTTMLRSLETHDLHTYANAY